MFGSRCALVIALLVVLATSAEAQTVTIASPNFDTLGGKISGTLDLNAFDPAPSSITSAMGTSGWYGLANATDVLNLGFRADVEVNQSPNSIDVGMINYALGASLGGLLGLEMPDSYLWQPMAGVSYLANKIYTFSIDVDAGSLLNVTALGSRGFGIGLTSGSSTTSPGTFVADSLSNPSLLSVSALTGTQELLTISFSTGNTPPTGDMGIAVFAGRGTQPLSLALLNNYQMDHASLAMAAVPEPSSGMLMMGGVAVLNLWFRARRIGGRRPIEA